MARATRRNFRVFSGIFSPISHLLRAGKKSIGAVTNTAKGIVGKGINGVDRVGLNITGEMNAAVGNLGRRFTRKGGRRNRKNSRKNRKNSRKNSRKDSRKN